MYGKVFNAKVSAVTIFTPKEGSEVGSSHGMMVTAGVDTSSLDFFADLDFGSKTDTFAALLNDECPVEYPFELQFVKKENVELQFGKVKEPCSVEKVVMTGFDNGVYSSKISIKCPNIAKVNRAEFVGLHMQTVDFLLTPTQEELVSHEAAAPQKEKKARKPRTKKTDPVFEASGGVDVE